jgi:choline transport protein
MSEVAKESIAKRSDALEGGNEDETVVAVENGVVINASGYRDQLRRQYGLLGLAGIAVTVDNAWVALGSSISVSIRMGFLVPEAWVLSLANWWLGWTVNGGPPGIIFGLIAALFYYTFIGLGLAEVRDLPCGISKIEYLSDC